MESARDFADRLASLLRREQGALADFLLALADFDARRLWEPLGYTSLFYFLHRALKLSAGAAYHRKTAAELLQRIPAVIEPLRDGRLCLSSVVELSKVLTPENASAVLPRFFHASKQEAKAMAAEIAPREMVPQRVVVTALPARRAAGSSAPVHAALALDLDQAFHPGEMMSAPTAAVAVSQVPSCASSTPVQSVELAPPAQTPAPRSEAQPLTADLRRLHVTVSKRFVSKLEAARDALSHSHPGADVEAILEAGLDLVLDRAAKRKGLVKKPRTQPAPDDEGSDPRQVPAAVRREVFLRDDGRCQWPTAGGGICGSTHRVELDHVVPAGRGGRPTISNLRVLCGFHNGLAARQVYGAVFMDRFTRRASTDERQLPAARSP